jgi:hypothetical protein
MKILSKILRISMLLSIPFLFDVNEASTKTIFVPISQGSNLYTQSHQPLYMDESNEKGLRIDASATYRYMQTRKGDLIAKKLFDYSTLTFQGNQDSTGATIDRSSNALVAEYFGFAPDANFKVKLEPRIKNHVIDLQVGVGGERFWAQANVPITYSQWKINNDGIPKATGSLGTRKLQGQDGTSLEIKGRGMSNDEITANGTYVKTLENFDNIWIKALDVKDKFSISDDMKVKPLVPAGSDGLTASSEQGMGSWGSISNSNSINFTNTLQALTFSDTTGVILSQASIDQAKSVKKGLEGYTFGSLAEKTYNNFNFSNTNLQSDWKVADLHLQIGYDFYKKDTKYFSVYLKGIVPTGTDIDRTFAKKAFNPIIGNGGHFELGAGINGAMELWSKDTNESSLVGKIDGYMTHMFGKTQFRTFDKTGMPMSRYAIVKQLTYDSSADTSTGNDVYYYKHMLKQLGDLNNGEIKVYSALRGEAMIDLTYSHKNWEIGGGYSLSGQTREEASDLSSDYDNHYYGFKAGAKEDDLLVTLKTCPTADTSQQYMDTYATSNMLNASPKSAAVNKVQALFYAKTSGDVGIDKSGGAYKYPTNTGDEGQNGTAKKDVFQLPEYNRSGLMDGQMLHRIFAHVDYAWTEKDWCPQIGIVGSFGFDTKSYRTAQYWDIGARGGISY